MRVVEPFVALIAETKPLQWSIQKYLNEIGDELLGDKWVLEHDRPSAEEVEEFGGRLCYNSFAPGLNPNVTLVRAKGAGYIRNLLEQHHGSVLEHPSATFLFANVSRVFTHELVRHRAGMAYSQESLRYVRLSEIKFWWPAVFRDDPDAARRALILQRGTALLEAIEQFQRDVAESFNLDGEDFARKKAVTSAMRRFVPMGMATAILCTANFRALRHLITMRTAPGAEEEIRLVFDQVAALAVDRWPATFQDFERQADGSWVPKHEKV
jgi:thymidylate synthase (FAD)